VNHISGEFCVGYLYLYSKRNIFYFQIYPEENPFQINVGSQYYFSFPGKGKQTTILLQKINKFIGSEFAHLLGTDNID
jgi:hypothetical protein